MMLLTGNLTTLLMASPITLKEFFGNAFSSLKGGLNDIRHGLIDWWRGGMDYASKACLKFQLRSYITGSV